MVKIESSVTDNKYMPLFWRKQEFVLTDIKN